ncbi:MAG: geranylgeranylglycerol-phosphate geranylgeranyltransferase [Paludibacter sp.]|nr:geranylgeranylglycerol-phosphate geranylgeranyltransferase [Paludibacter sp.]
MAVIQFFKLIRYQNLLFLALIQLLLQQFIVSPILQKYGFEYISADTTLLLLITATVFIAAAGYVINDYFDLKIDRINKPNEVLVGTVFSKQQAMLIHQTLTAIGVVTGLVLAYNLHSFTLAFLFIVLPGLLWFYSASYKRQFAIGNFIVALMAACSILIVAISSVAELKNNYADLLYQTPIPAEIYSWIGGFAAFSFLLTLMRELVKDLQDREGDSEVECRTMAIVWGEFKTKLVIYTLTASCIALLIFINQKFISFEGTLTFKYILFGIIVPLLVFCYLLYSANQPQAYKTASRLLKYIMFIGVLYSVVFYFLMAKMYGLSLFNIFIIQ